MRDDPLLTDWIAASGSVGAAIAAVVLLFLAYRQMKANREQADATRKQFDLMVLEAERDRLAREADDAQRKEDQASRDVAVRARMSRSSWNFATTVPV